MCRSANINRCCGRGIFYFIQSCVSEYLAIIMLFNGIIIIFNIDLVQTLATLQFAERASRLVNVARANEILDDQAMLQKAHSEIARLKGRVNVLVRKLKAANSGIGSLDSQANNNLNLIYKLLLFHYAYP